MVKDDSRSLDRIFHALSDSTRREILKMLTRREQLTVGELAAPFRMSLAAVSKHIKVLEEARLLTREKDGRIHRCAMNGEPLSRARDVIGFYQQFWEGRFRALEQYLLESQPKGEKNGSRKE
jgi:DNA-binding transcriptional ArsR family regulator